MKEECHIFVESDNDAKDGMRFSLIPDRFRYYMGDEAVNLQEICITYDLPGDLSTETIRKKAIETLMAKQDRVVAEAQQTKTELQTKINDLLLLTHQAAKISD